MKIKRLIQGLVDYNLLLVVTYRPTKVENHTKFTVRYKNREGQIECSPAYAEYMLQKRRDAELRHADSRSSIYDLPLAVRIPVIFAVKVIVSVCWILGLCDLKIVEKRRASRYNGGRY